jgi:uncharacterized protein (DUF1810 family)
MKKLAEILSLSGNSAVIKISERKFPAMAIQGDSMHGILESPKELKKCMELGDFSAASDEADYLVEKLLGYMSFYEKTLKEMNIERPY